MRKAELGLGVLHDECDLGRVKFRVDRDDAQARCPAGEHPFNVLRAVLEGETNSVAWLKRVFCAKRMGKRLHPKVKFSVAQCLARAKRHGRPISVHVHAALKESA